MTLQENPVKDARDPKIWYEQGLSHFAYASEEGNGKVLSLASKSFKMACQLDPAFFDAWVGWGNTLLRLGLFHSENHFFIDAKEKFQKALALSKGQPDMALAKLYWDYGAAWVEIAKNSGEAIDLRFAIDAFLVSMKLAPASPELLNDCAKAYLEMGFLVADTKPILQAVHYLLRAVEKAPEYADGWESLAESYSQAYLSTMNEKFISKASECYEMAHQLSPKSSECLLNWAQILGEAGRHGPVKYLHQSVEKCARASMLNPKDPLVTAQWVESLSLLGARSNRLDLMIEAEQKILNSSDAYPDDPDLWHAYGICLLSLGNYYEDPDYFEMAIDKVQYSLSIDRTAAEHWHTLGVIHTRYADLTGCEDLAQRAHRFFDKAIGLNPANPQFLFDAARNLLHLSELTEDLPSLQASIAYFEALLQNQWTTILQHPAWLFEYGSALEWLAEMSDDEEHIRKALEIFSQVLLMDPDSPNIYAKLAGCYRELASHTCGEVNYQKAIEFYRLALRHDPENDQIWLDLGVSLIHLAHHTNDTLIMNQLYLDAEVKLSRAGQLGHLGALYGLACLYSILGKTNESMEFIRKALYAKALPPIEEMLDDEWMDNVRESAVFAQFLHALESKLQARET